MNRREYLAVAAGASLAGCAGLNEELADEEESDDDPEPIVGFPTDDETARNADESRTESEDDLRDITHLHGLSGQTYPEPVAGYYHRRYEWDAVGGAWWLELQIPRTLEGYYRSRLRVNDRGVFVSDPYDDDLIAIIAGEFERVGTEYGLSDREVVDLAMAFVQQLEYTPDEVATGFTQHTYYPVETLIDQGGDCEDTAILLAAILRDLGYGCVLLAFWDDEHMALGVRGEPSIPGTYYEYDGARYYYVETTGEGWEVGQKPSQIDQTSAEIQQILAHPTVVYGWETAVTDAGGVAVRSRIGNVGTQTAPAVTFVAELEDRLGRVHSRESTGMGMMGRDTEEETVISLEPNDVTTMRVNTAIQIGAETHDIDQSDWRSPV